MHNPAPFMKFDVSVPLFPNTGRYPATVQLANGSQVKVALDVTFAV